jgi:alkylhydroperoxidase family enzyme
MARAAGLTDLQIAGLDAFEFASEYSDFEKDVLRFAEQWSNSGTVTPDVVERLKRSLSPEHLVILAATAAQASFTCRFNNTFGVELP